MHGNLLVWVVLVKFAAMTMSRSTFVRVVDHATRTKHLFSNAQGLSKANIDARDEVISHFPSGLAFKRPIHL